VDNTAGGDGPWICSWTHLSLSVLPQKDVVTNRLCMDNQKWNLKTLPTWFVTSHIHHILQLNLDIFPHPLAFFYQIHGSRQVTQILVLVSQAKDTQFGRSLSMVCLWEVMSCSGAYWDTESQILISQYHCVHSSISISAVCLMLDSSVILLAESTCWIGFLFSVTSVFLDVYNTLKPPIWVLLWFNNLSLP